MTAPATAARRVGPALAFRLTAFAFAVTMFGTTIPTPLYPGYEQRFGFGPLTVTVVFAAYAVGVLVALLVFGRASDSIGRRPVLVAGLLLAATSSVVFLVVGGMRTYALPVLLAGRVVSGLSAGIFTGTATAALTDHAGPDRQLRASIVAAVANIGGLGLGPLVAGLLARHVGAPLRTPFALHLLLVAAALVAVAVVPETVDRGRAAPAVLQRLHVPASARAVLLQAGTAGFAGFAVLGLFTAVSPAVLTLLGHRNPALTGLVAFSVFFASACGQVGSARLPGRVALLGGTATLVVGMIGVGAAIGERSLPLLLAGGLVAGVGQGLSFRAALSAVTAASAPQERGSIASSFFVLCYLGISLPVVGIGASTRAYGLVHTGEVFAAAVALLALTALVSLARSRPAAREA